MVMGDLLARFAVHVMETLCFLGLIGSLGVVSLSLLEDVSGALHPAEKDETA